MLDTGRISGERQAPASLHVQLEAHHLREDKAMWGRMQKSTFCNWMLLLLEYGREKGGVPVVP